MCIPIRLRKRRFRFPPLLLQHKMELGSKSSLRHIENPRDLGIPSAKVSAGRSSTLDHYSLNSMVQFAANAGIVDRLVDLPCLLLPSIKKYRDGSLMQFGRFVVLVAEFVYCPISRWKVGVPAALVLSSGMKLLYASTDMDPFCRFGQISSMKHFGWFWCSHRNVACAGHRLLQT
ncbi:hypothetical protein Nepgr_021333 [Nepenthes gracilis]|uniref:Uncharacterized protein n=1 Tax=Nepenthes gracilis TaxID=150966 RepID=A0AAD3SYM2_NEPGR|nr:hypothetical protein Nepgr_021333 [Nepenthes gracilis]